MLNVRLSPRLSKTEDTVTGEGTGEVTVDVVSDWYFTPSQAV